MCGIAGILRFDDRPIEDRRLSHMLDQLRWRGPDGGGQAVYNRCAIGCRQLKVLDVNASQQPMGVGQKPGAVQRARSGSLHIVFNGEIFNYHAIRKKLTRFKHPFHSEQSDTEVLLFGYRQWGKQMPKHLRGMFAFAIWDEDARELFLCRDRLGQKPLYLMQRDNEVLFASLMSGLIAGLPKEEAIEINRQALATYLQLGDTLGQQLIQGMQELPPAHSLTILADGTQRLESYWQPPPISKHSTSLGAVDAVREVLTESVNLQLESQVPMGCILSGGLDSSVIAAIAHKRMTLEGGDPLKTYSILMPNAITGDGERARHVAAAIGTNHTELRADASDPLEDLQTIMNAIGMPIGTPAILPNFWVARTASQAVKVALSGHGGTELFGGHDRYLGMALLDRYQKWLKFIPPKLVRPGRLTGRRIRLRKLLAAAHAGPAPASWYRQLLAVCSDQDTTDLGLSLADQGAGLLEDWPQEYDETHAAMRWDLMNALPYGVLRRVDHASMIFALEVRNPMLDTQVADLAGHLPSRVLMPGNKPEALLKAFAMELLPVGIVQSKQPSLAQPPAQWLTKPLAEVLLDRLSTDALHDLGLNPSPVQHWMQSLNSGESGYERRLFAMMQLSIWQQWLTGLTRI